MKQLAGETKTAWGLRLVTEHGKTVREASREVDCSEAAIRLLLKKHLAESQGLCSCCGAPIGEDGKYKKSTKK